MKNELRGIIAVVILGLLAGGAAGASITFNKSLDVPSRTFTWNGTVYEINNVGLYGIGQDIGITIDSPGVSKKLVTLFLKNKSYPSPISVWHKTLDGESSTVIPYSEIIHEAQGVSGTFGLLVTNSDPGKEGEIIAVKPIIISEYILVVTPENTEKTASSTINVTIRITKNGVPSNVSDSVKVEFEPLNRASSPSFYADARQTNDIGIYTAVTNIPTNAAGLYRLYALITTDYKIFGDYPETKGIAMYSGIITITQPASTPTPTPTQTSTSPPADGGGGGGGGGGALSGEDLKNIETKEIQEKYLSKDVPASYTFKQSDTPVSEIVMTSNINAGDITVKIETLRSSSSQISTSPPGFVYKNLNIIVGTSGFAVPKNIKEAVIKFRVDNSWIENNNLEDGSIKMIKWDGSKWIQLETTKKDKDGKYTYYEARTNAFSTFAIAGLKSESVPTAVPSITPPATPETTGTTVIVITPEELPDITPVLAAGGIVLIAIIAGVYIKRKEIFKK